MKSLERRSNICYSAKKVGKHPCYVNKTPIATCYLFQSCENVRKLKRSCGMMCLTAEEIFKIFFPGIMQRNMNILNLKKNEERNPISVLSHQVVYLNRHHHL